MPIPLSLRSSTTTSASSSSSSSIDDGETQGSLWGKCMALLGQAATTLPVSPPTTAENSKMQKPLGAEIIDVYGIDMNDPNQLVSLIQNISHRAMTSASPFIWHHDRRHAPSLSTVCKRSSASNGIPHPNFHLKVAPIIVQTPATNPPSSFNVDQANGKTFPLFGFLQGGIGDAKTQCICAVNHPDDLSKCTVLDDTCQSFWVSSSSTAAAQSNWTGCAVMAAACTQLSGNRHYQRADASVVLECLRNTPLSLSTTTTSTTFTTNAQQQQQKEEVRCPELGPSDHWGLFPVGCTLQVQCNQKNRQKNHY